MSTNVFNHKTYFNHTKHVYYTKLNIMTGVNCCVNGCYFCYSTFYVMYPKNLTKNAVVFFR